MTDQKGLVSPPSDLQSSASTIQPLHQPLQPPHSHLPKLLVSTKSSISSQQDGGAAQDELVAEHIRPITCAKWRNDCNRSSANSSTHREGNMDVCIYGGGNWLEEDKIFPFKKRRVLLNLDNAPSTATTTLQGEVLKNARNARAGRKCTMKIRTDRVPIKDDDTEGPPEMINGTLAAEDIVKGEKIINNSTSTRCTRKNGKGWRCSQPSFAGYTMCYNHWTSTKNSRRKERKKKKKSNPKSAIPKVNVRPTSSGTTLMRREKINADNARKSRKCTKNIGTDQRDDDFEGVSDVMNGIPAEKIIMEEKSMDNCTNTRCARANGKRWRCSQPSFASSSSSEHHWTTRKKESKKKNNHGSVPRKVASSNVKITPSSPTTLLQRENMAIGNARKSKKCTNQKRVDQVLNKDDDFEGVADVMINSIPAAKEIKMEEKTMDNITNPRCTRSSGHGWRCSQPSFAGYSMCEYHCAAKKKKKNSIPHKAAESQVKPTSTTQFTALDTGSNLSDIGESDGFGEVLPKRRIAAVKARSISSLLH